MGLHKVPLIGKAQTMNTAKLLRDNLVLLMQRLDISQSSAAKRCGISQKTINNIVNIGTNPGITNVTLKNIEKIAQGFQVTVPELLSPSLGVTTIRELSDNRFKEILTAWLSLTHEGKDRLLGAASALKLVYIEGDQEAHDRLHEKVSQYNAKQDNLKSATDGIRSIGTTEKEYLANLDPKKKS